MTPCPQQRSPVTLRGDSVAGNRPELTTLTGQGKAVLPVAQEPDLPVTIHSETAVSR